MTWYYRERRWGAGIHCRTGDASYPGDAEAVILAHVCNDEGELGCGFDLAISKRWKAPEEQYRLWHRGELENARPFALGQVQFVRIDQQVVVANMLAQQGVRRRDDPPAIRYEALSLALDRVGEEALSLDADVRMPRIGCGRAGGSWDRVEPLIEKQVVRKGIAVWVYDWESIL